MAGKFSLKSPDRVSPAPARSSPARLRAEPAYSESSSGKKHATPRPSADSRTGSSEHLSTAYGHLSWNLHPWYTSAASASLIRDILDSVDVVRIRLGYRIDECPGVGVSWVKQPRPRWAPTPLSCPGTVLRSGRQNAWPWQDRA